MRLTFVLIALSTGLAWAQPPVDDPIFGMHYDARRVHFEKSSALRPPLLLRCPALWDKIPKGEEFYVFAEATVDGKEYMIVSSKTTQDSGAALIIKGNRCVESNPERLLGDPTPGDSKDEMPSNAVIKAVVSDALRRYSQAYGSKKNFLEALRTFGLRSEELPKGLREELAVFSREP